MSAMRLVICATLLSILMCAHAEMRSSVLTPITDIGVRYYELLNGGHATYECDSRPDGDSVQISSCSHTTTASCIMADSYMYFVEFSVPYPVTTAYLTLTSLSASGEQPTVYTQAVDPATANLHNHPRGSYKQSCDARCNPACARTIGPQMTTVSALGSVMLIDVTPVLTSLHDTNQNQSTFIFRISAPDVHISTKPEESCTSCPSHPVMSFATTLNSNSSYIPTLNIQYEYPPKIPTIAPTRMPKPTSTPTSPPRAANTSSTTQQREEHEMRVVTGVTSAGVLLVLGVALTAVYCRKKREVNMRYSQVPQQEME